jgi:hypothetical protein
VQSTVKGIKKGKKKKLIGLKEKKPIGKKINKEKENKSKLTR